MDACLTCASYLTSATLWALLLDPGSVPIHPNGRQLLTGQCDCCRWNGRASTSTHTTPCASGIRFNPCESQINCRRRPRHSPRQRDVFFWRCGWSTQTFLHRHSWSPLLDRMPAGWVGQDSGKHFHSTVLTRHCSVGVEHMIAWYFDHWHVN